MFLNNFSTKKTCNYIFYTNFIQPAANKSIPRIYDFCTILVYHFVPFMTKIMVQHMGDAFLILTDLNYLTNHITLKLFPLFLPIIAP